MNALAEPSQVPVAPPSASAPGADANSPLGLEEAFRAHHKMVWRSLRRLGVRSHELDDAVQDVFVVVARRLHEFEGRSSLKTWIFAIALRVAQSARRDAARLAKKREAIAHVASTHPHTDPAIDQAEASHDLYRLLDRLETDQREVFVLLELEQLTGREVASLLGVKMPTVYSRARLAREKLRRWAEQSQTERSPAPPSETTAPRGPKERRR